MFNYTEMANNTIILGDLTNSSINFTSQCQSVGQELLVLINNPMMFVDTINATIVADNMDNETAYLGASCSASVDCNLYTTGQGYGIQNYQMTYNETIAIWMMCQGDITENITLTITAVFYSNYSLPVDMTSSSSGSAPLSPGGIAGIVIACVVVCLFIVGLLVSLKGTIWCKNQFKCCKNQTQSIPEESPRDKDLERRETGLDGKHEPIGHQPSN